MSSAHKLPTPEPCACCGQASVRVVRFRPYAGEGTDKMPLYELPVCKQHDVVGVGVAMIRYEAEPKGEVDDLL